MTACYEVCGPRGPHLLFMAERNCYHPKPLILSDSIRFLVPQWIRQLVRATSSLGVSYQENYERFELLGDAWLKYCCVVKVFVR